MSEDELSARMQILEMIESGRISAEEGLRLLDALSSAEFDVYEAETGEIAEEDVAEAVEAGAAPSDTGAQPLAFGEPVGTAVEEPFLDGYAASVEHGPVQVEVISLPDAAVEDDRTSSIPLASPAGGPPADLARWRRWWLLPFGAGAGITIFGGMLMYWTLQATGASFWLFCATLPFTLGVLVLVLAWISRTAPWLHLRVQQSPGESPQRIAISLPIPVGPTAWLLRTFGHYIPKLDDTALDEVILAVGKHANADTPIYIQVDEGEQGEKVEIYIG